MDYKQYFNTCASHDWFFDFSDDFIVYKRGLENRDKLISISKQDVNYKKIFDLWSAYAYQQPDQNIMRPTWSDELLS